MDVIAANATEDENYTCLLGGCSPRGTAIQVAISLSLGFGAFFTFCLLRPRWTGLYAARKKQKNEAIVLPELPQSFFGWIVPLWRITDQQILASAGLDAYVFLTFFKLAIKFLFLTLLFSLIVIKPVHDTFPEEDELPPGNHTGKNHTKHHDTGHSLNLWQHVQAGKNSTPPYLHIPENFESDYLWMYVVFAYLFSAIAIYLIISETRRVIEVRQEYLGTKHSITDRTLRLSGIPFGLQDEARIKEFIEDLDIGKVESVTLCRNWKELDHAMTARMDALRRLEEAYTIYLGHRRIERNAETLPVSQPSPPNPQVADGEENEEDMLLLGGDGPAQVRPYARSRPVTTIRYGFLGYRSRKVDAIEYYEEQLQKADERVKQLRKQEFTPTPLAFVTMDSVAACQMVIQAVLNPSPLQLIANQSPAPADVIWPNTYLSRRNRMLRSWTITALIVILTIFWSGMLVPVAGLLNKETIGKVFPSLKKALSSHKTLRSLVETQVPTLISSLLMVLVPYAYYWLSWCQGHISQGEIELSSISKNFFFVFFNFFVIFTILGTVSNLTALFEQFGDAIRNVQNVAYELALMLQKLLSFYVNFIILQGVGLFPFRLLEMGSVSLYPIYRMGAKTPRDYAELVQPPVFSYGFYLPSALLIFIICMVYSVLRDSWQVLLAGLVYFVLGHFVYKYQLLYAMDHRQQNTGRAWGMICDRIFVGLIFFQVTTAGQLILKRAIARSLILVPLIVATVWVCIMYGKTYKPLMKFIALSSVKRLQPYSDDQPSYAPSLVSTDLAPERNVWADSNGGSAERSESEGGSNAANPDEWRERPLRYVNPSLVAPLRGVWIADRNLASGGVGDGERAREDEDADGVL